MWVVLWGQELKAKGLTQGRLRYRRDRHTHAKQSKKIKAKMAAEQSMTQAIIQTATGGTKAAIMTIREADDLVKHARVNAASRSHGPALNQPIFLRPEEVMLKTW